MHIRDFLFLIFFLIISIGLPSLAPAGENEEALLANVTNQLNEKWENLFYDFSDLTLKKYCPIEYRQIQDSLLFIDHENQRITLADLRTDRDPLLAELLSHCGHASLVLDLEDQFNNHMALIMTDAIERTQKLLFNLDLELSWDTRQKIADQLVIATIEKDYQASKVLEFLTTLADGSPRI